MEFDKIYYLPGDLCEVKHAVPNKPIMVVKQKVSKLIRPKPSDIKKDSLLGIICYWFTTDFTYQEHIFSTKDLHKI